MRRKFDEWYQKEVSRQLDGASDAKEIELINLQPIDLSMARMKELSAEWLVEAMEYIAENPLFLMNGFLKSGITRSLKDGNVDNSEDDDITSQGSEESTDDENYLDDSMDI